ncbi:MAG: hypothetical protein N3D15_09050 [Syntrophorhabdaceae bacterium]|nr:hypothetical protein [Syntrophorhabdaceae bacterium]
MKVNVRVESNLRIKNLFEPPFYIDLGEDEADLKGLLKNLKRLYPYMRFIESDEMGDDLRHVYLNGVSHFTFPEGLNKKVKEGDTVLVEAYMDPLAGG